MNIVDLLKKLYWKLPIPFAWKNSFVEYVTRNDAQYEDNDYEPNDKEIIISDDASVVEKYLQDILSIPHRRKHDYQEFIEHTVAPGKTKLVAYYLTQYHPTDKNNLWWGKGTTEWTNVTKAVPQFPGHYQPRLPADLGFYDLRLKENIEEQIKIAKNFGVDAFCFYYYWFNGERALEKPLNIFLDNSDLDIEFSICWCNEDWTKRYSGVSTEVLLSVGKTEDSYRKFIDDVIPLFRDKRYIRIENKPILTIYRPTQIPEMKKTLEYWRYRVKEELGTDLYIIASQEFNVDIDWCKKGFDAISQFQPASIQGKISDINSKIDFIRKDFSGKVFDYKEIVEERMYLPSNGSKVFPAVMPMWDNTSRRNNKGYIFINSTPELYKQWMKDAISIANDNSNLEEKMVFINAWNEWGEGAYLEPDREYGYAYLEATLQAKEETLE